MDERQELQELITALDRVIALFDTPGWNELTATLQARAEDCTNDVMHQIPGTPRYLSPEEVAYRQGRVRELNWLLERQQEALKERATFVQQLTRLNEAAQETE